MKWEKSFLAYSVAYSVFLAYVERKRSAGSSGMNRFDAMEGRERGRKGHWTTDKEDSNLVEMAENFVSSYAWKGAL